jgi:putative efflux protein, MATE family
MTLLRRGLQLDKQDMRRIFAITLPAMLEMLFSQFFGMFDTIMLGQTKVATEAIAAVGLTNNPINMIYGIMTAMNVGATAAVAWSVGARDYESAKAITRNMLVVDVLLGILSTVLVVSFSKQIVLFMGAQADTLAYASEYLSVIAMGFLPAALTMGVTASLRGAGLTRIPMMYNLFSNLLDVFLNYGMIYGRLGFPEMGVLGASLSTTVSRFIAMSLALCFIFFGKSPLRIRLTESFRLKKDIIKKIFRVGIPTGIEQFIMQIGFMLFTKTVAGLGTTMMAAHNIGLNVNGLSWVPSQAFGVAATTVVGQNLGAGEPEKARDQAKLIHRLSLIAAAFVALLYATCADGIVRLYINDAAVWPLSAGVLRLIAIGLPAIATQLPIAAALRGARDSLFPLIASASGIWIFRVFVCPLLVYNMGLGLNGAWLSIVLDQATRAAVVYVRFIRGKWMLVKDTTAPLVDDIDV